MKSYNPENERVKRQYFTYLKEARRCSEASLDSAAKALNRFEQYGKFRSFKSFHFQQAIAFKRHLANQAAIRTGQRLSQATQYGTLRALRDFFHWLADKPGYRSRLSFSDAEYFNLSEKETRIAKAELEQPVPTLEQIKHVIQTMPSSTDIKRRDRALISFAILTGARDGAIASLKLKHVDLIEGLVRQDAREVRTKFSKTFTTWFFPVGKEFSQIVDDWVAHLQKDRLWGPSDPLFPATEIALGPGHRFGVSGLKRAHWTTASPIRRIFKEAFEAAGLPYFNPHSFRKTLALLGEHLCASPEQLKAWSQNLGHESVLTTLSSYGSVPAARQAEIIRGLGAGDEGPQQFLEMAEKLKRMASMQLGR